MKKILIATAAVTALSAAYAEETNKYPGSSWGSIGNTSPSEEGNVLATVHVEQGVVLKKSNTLTMVPFVSATVSKDSDGHDWNNKAILRAGIKLERALLGGSIALRLGVAHENRFSSHETASSPYISVGHWFGWGHGTRSPGSTWGQLGYGTSPGEKNNTALMVHAEQGIYATKVGSGKLVPFVDATIARDSEGYDWNNKNQLGAGVKYALPVAKNGTLNVGVKYTHETKTSSDVSASNVGIFANYWLGW
ncbi:hypothetical protein A3C89_03320 [Candidatus Kaiserbacteria bacterium RIFCSPHIGHO2_02_FULL_50_50]|uniref:Transporter n=1 Tax=Candidatus Kaiserbacteria bacterium RIFCSPHIGHO2_02_FULL_50_50 TaxID=1798492 RepID=A0A1F6DEU2_9BACT|nr:MAG: hypothetical protein A3C89_03320 [Candidatus Kaiserbacteria bacterium RIFCSPHIGHO2_02_FULL_50_50]OGG89241.1 MAG: hypothetical protein A3G62_01300 [Candidatus Kaiserbacteria bacterium RIFCSPLOWO2_12_FULL_50_10]